MWYVTLSKSLNLCEPQDPQLSQHNLCFACQTWLFWRPKPSMNLFDAYLGQPVFKKIGLQCPGSSQGWKFLLPHQSLIFVKDVLCASGSPATGYTASKTRRKQTLSHHTFGGELHIEIDVCLCVNKEVSLTKGQSRGRLATDTWNSGPAALKIHLVSQGFQHQLGPSIPCLFVLDFFL